MEAGASTFAVTAGVMLVATVAFVGMYARKRFKQRSYLLLPAITGIAGTMYAVMALSSAGALGADVVTEARYLDWFLTTPLIVAYIGLTAGAGRRLVGAAMAADVVMIVTGYVATVSSGAVKWAAFTASSAAFGYLLYLLLTRVTTVAGDRPPAVQSTFRTIRDLTVVLWCVYPLLWLAGPFGVGLVRLVDYHFIVAALDLTAKVGFDAIIAIRASRVSSVMLTDDPTGAPQ